MPKVSRTDVDRFVCTFGRLEKELQAIQGKIKNPLGLCVMVFPADWDPNEIQWPAPYDSDKYDRVRTDLLREAWSPGWPIREYMLTEWSDEVGRFVEWAEHAGQVVRDLPSGVVDDVHEPPENPGFYVWLDVVLDLALAKLPGSQLRVAYPEQGGRWRIPRSFPPVPAGQDHASVVWFTEVVDVLQASGLVIEELRIRLQRRGDLADIGERINEAISNGKSPIEAMTMEERGSLIAEWTEWSKGSSSRRHAAFDEQRGLTAGTIKSLLDAKRSADTRQRKKKEAARKPR